MKILCIGDPHIKKNNIPRSTEMVNASIRMVEEHKPDILVIMGDTLDTFENVNTTAQCLAVDLVIRASKLVPVYLLIGNHDYPNPLVFMDGPHPFTALHHVPNVTVVDKVVTSKFGDHQLTFLPYVATGRFIEACDTSPGWKDSHIIFAHQEFKGCKMGAITSENGDQWSSDYPPVISGHIHDHQRPQTNILYVGCPVQHAFGDNSLKTVSMITLEDSGQYSEERLSLRVKKLVLIKIEANKLNTIEVQDTDIVKVVVMGTIHQNNAAKKLNIVSDLRRRGHKVVFKDYKEKVDFKTLGESNDNPVYGNLLYERIKQRDDLKELYQKMFA